MLSTGKIPEWYQQYKAQRESANVAKTEVNKLNPFDNTGDSGNKQDSVASMLQGLQLELDKIKGKIQGEGHVANFTQVEEYAGTIFYPYNAKIVLHVSLDTLSDLRTNTWVIDTGATAHMCTNAKMFYEMTHAPHPVTVKLPDGGVRYITHIGNVRIGPKLTLQGVLYTLSFKFNLISVNKLINTNKAKFTFYPSYCELQDLRTEQVLMEGKNVGNLYVHDNCTANNSNKALLRNNANKESKPCNKLSESNVSRNKILFTCLIPLACVMTFLTYISGIRDSHMLPSLLYST